MTYSSKKDPTSHCFSTILQRFVCGRNLPTHSSPPLDPKTLPKPDKITTFSNSPNYKNDPDIIWVKPQVQVRAQTQIQGPGIVARLMGLDSLSTNNNMDSLFRSKSLNSVHFLPDFDPTKASFHRRARTSASFHEQRHSNLLVTVDENNVEDNGLKMKKSEMGHEGDSKRRKEERENVVILKGNERRKSRKNGSRGEIGEAKKKIEENFTTSSSNDSCYSNSTNRLKKNVGGGGNNIIREKYVMQKRRLQVVNTEKNVNVNVGSTVTSKRRAVHKEDDLNVELQSDALSRSPVSVLDHHHHEFDFPLKDDESQVNSTSWRKPSSTIKIHDDMLPHDMIPRSKNNNEGLNPNRIGYKHKLVKSEVEVAEYFFQLLGQISKVVEEHIRDPKWVQKYEGCKVHYMEELSLEFGEEMLELLLVELLDELIE